jgi:hypothetical protein
MQSIILRHPEDLETILEVIDDELEIHMPISTRFLNFLHFE